MKKNKKQVIWKWVMPRALILSAIFLVEVSHLCREWRRYPLDMLGWGIIGRGVLEMWRRWRRAEIELIRHVRLPQGHDPRISLLAGQDLACRGPCRGQRSGLCRGT
jgi:hypothetical protein